MQSGSSSSGRQNRGVAAKVDIVKEQLLKQTQTGGRGKSSPNLCAETAHVGEREAVVY